MNIYKLDFNKFVLMMLPIRLRRPVMAAFLRAMIAPVAWLHGEFIAFRSGVMRGLALNGQVCHLQGILNDTFDFNYRRIYLSDANALQRLFIYTGAEDDPLYIHTRAENEPVYLHTAADFADSGYDFYVNLNGVVLTERQLIHMGVILNQYKLATKKYKIR